MIKVGIIGADTPEGGELIRILAMHPDVEIIGAQAPGLEGTPITDRHHGLIGETRLSFTGALDYSKLNALFVCNTISFGAAEFTQMRIVRPDLKVIMLYHSGGIDAESHGIVYGLPELNRKLLVRGATGAAVPTSFSSMALVGLIPFASHLLLHGDLKIHIIAPQAILEAMDLSMVKEELTEQLQEIQRSFNGHIEITTEISDTRRSCLMQIDFDCNLTTGQILELYEIYDDHNFAYVTQSAVGVSEVAGTNKCVVSVLRGEPGKVRLQVIADGRLRGGAGEAVHILNLMFGLHERTGLALKAIDFTPVG